MQIKRPRQKCPACGTQNVFDPTKELESTKGKHVHKMRCTWCPHILSFSEARK